MADDGRQAPTWWLIPLSMWVTTLVISGLTPLIPCVTRVYTHLLGRRNHQVGITFSGFENRSPKRKPAAKSKKLISRQGFTTGLPPSKGTKVSASGRCCCSCWCQRCAAGVPRPASGCLSLQAARSCKASCSSAYGTNIGPSAGRPHLKPNIGSGEKCRRIGPRCSARLRRWRWCGPVSRCARPCTLRWWWGPVALHMPALKWDNLLIWAASFCVP